MRVSVLLYNMSQAWNEKESLRLDAEKVYTALGYAHAEGDFAVIDSVLLKAREDLDAMANEQEQTNPDLADPDSIASMDKEFKDRVPDYDGPDYADDDIDVAVEEKEEEEGEDNAYNTELQSLMTRRKEIVLETERRLLSAGLIQSFEAPMNVQALKPATT